MGAVAEKIRDYYNDPVNLSDLTEKRALFLQGLRETGVVLRACERADISRQLAYIWRSAYPEFKKQWDDALEDPVDEVEETLLRLARSGQNITATLAYLRHNRHKYREETRIIVSKEDVDQAIEAALVEHQLPGLEAAPSYTEDMDQLGQSSPVSIESIESTEADQSCLPTSVDTPTGE